MQKNTTILKRAVYLIICLVVLVGFDQFTKSLAVQHLMVNGPFVLIENVLELLYVENRGAAFGIMNGMRGFFLILAPLVSVFLFYVILKMPEDRHYIWLDLCMAGIIAGALGNFIDRLTHVYVVDFIYFMPIDFPVFNVADIYVTCSCFGLVLLMLLVYRDEDLENIPFFGSKKEQKPN